MPKYAFEVSAILPAGEELSPRQADALSRALANRLTLYLAHLRHPQVEVNYEPPFEHVTGDMLPADENGIIRVGPSRPIDL